MDNTIKPSASNVEKFLLAQQDPHNWSEKIWASYEEDAKELHDLMLKKFHTDAQRDAQVTACAYFRAWAHLSQHTNFTML